jgi:myo-inositol catabolism protein IolC
LRRYLAGQASHEEAVYEISSRYRDIIEAYRRAEPAFDRGRE